MTKRSRVKDPEQYEALRKQGESKEKAARIANTSRRAAATKERRHRSIVTARAYGRPRGCSRSAANRRWRS